MEVIVMMRRSNSCYGTLRHKTNKIRCMGSSNKERDFELFDSSYDDIKKRSSSIRWSLIRN